MSKKLTIGDVYTTSELVSREIKQYEGFIKSTGENKLLDPAQKSKIITSHKERISMLKEIDKKLQKIILKKSK